MTKLRLDRLLYFLRFRTSRTKAQHWIDEGHIRLNGRRVTAHDACVAVGDVLTLPLARSACVIRIETMPMRRGPKDEARSHYQPLDAAPALRQAERVSPELGAATGISKP